MNISEIGRQRADYVELKVFVRAARSAHIMLTADRSESGFEIGIFIDSYRNHVIPKVYFICVLFAVNNNNEAYMIKQNKFTYRQGNSL